MSAEILDDTPNPDRLRNRWRNWAIGFGIWTMIGLSFASRSYLTNYRSGQNLSWQEAVFGYLTDFYLWGAASPLIFAIGRRFPIERERLPGRILFHFAVSIVFTLVVTAISIPLYWFSGYADKTLFPTFGTLFVFSMSSPYLLHQGLLVYWGTLVVAHAYKYYDQLQAGKIRAARLSSQLAQAQLTALKMQIHPHFLFNTLNSIAALLHKDPEAADLMIARLSDFLRLTLKSSDTSVVALDQELEFLTTYLEIEKIRFQDKLTVEIKVEPSALVAQVPNLILQPLIENALRHGIARQTAVGHLQIAARRESGRLLVKIADNGPGLANGNGKEPGILAAGVGLANTRARLEQLYEDDFSFEIKNKADGNGTVVDLNLPYLTESETMSS